MAKIVGNTTATTMTVPDVSGKADITYVDTKFSDIIVNATISGGSATVDKTPNEILEAYNSGKTVVAKTSFNGILYLVSAKSENEIVFSSINGTRSYFLIFLGDYWSWAEFDLATNDALTTFKNNLNDYVSKWELAASYTHEGNRVIQPTALDKTTGYFTCENHGLTEGQSLLTLEKLPYLYNTDIFIPSELYQQVNYSNSTCIIRLKQVTVIDENTFAIKNASGDVLTYTSAQNGKVDATKFCFETIEGGKFSGFNNLNIDMREYDIKIIANNPHIRVSFLINGIDGSSGQYLYATTYGHDGGIGRGIHITPVCGVYSQGKAVWSFDGKSLTNESVSFTRWGEKKTPIGANLGRIAPFHDVFTKSTNEAFCNNPIINKLTLDFYYQDQYMRNGGRIDIWKKKK